MPTVSGGQSSPAQPIYQAYLPIAYFGYLDQDDLLNVLPPGLAAQACGPVAAVDSLVFLQNQYPNIYGSNLVGDHLFDWITGAFFLVGYMHTTVQNGTTDTDFINGLISFMNAQVPGKTSDHFVIKSPGHTPTWQFLYLYLTEKQAVQVLIVPPDSPSSKGHYLSVTGIYWDAGDGMGTISVIDPLTGLPSKLDVALDSDSGMLDVDYKGVVEPIVAEYEESPVPEPSTVALLGVGVIILSLYAYGKRDKSLKERLANHGEAC